MNRKIGRIGSIAVAGLLLMAIAMATPAGAMQDLKITELNRYYLANTYWTPYYNGWLSNAELLGWTAGQRLYVNYKYPIQVGSITATQVNDNYNGFPGECVSFGKALSHIQTAGYRKGKRVMDGGIAQGTVIGVFKSDGTYDGSGATGHIAIFDAYVSQIGLPIGPKPPGFRVWDENYVSPHATGRHFLYTNGNGVSDADNYYVVQIP